MKSIFAASWRASGPRLWQLGKPLSALLAMGEPSAEAPPGALALGVPDLEAAVGIGGLPRGRLSEIVGHEGTGKTTLALQAVRQAQRGGEICAWIDADWSFSAARARQIGVCLRRLLLLHPAAAEDAWQMMQALMCRLGVGLLVVDPVAALVPRAELQRRLSAPPAATQTPGDGLPAALAHVVGAAYDSGCTLIMTCPPWHGAHQAVRYHAALRLEMQHGGPNAEDCRRRITVVKNRWAAPFCHVDTRLGATGCKPLAGLDP